MTNTDPAYDNLGPDNVVELRGVGRLFDGGSPTRALQPTDLTVRTGEFIAISGPSGSGKSTLLSILGLLDTPTEGTYHLAGCDTSQLTDIDLTAIRGQLIGFVFQSFHLMSYRTTIDNVAMSSLYQRTRRKHREAAAIDALTRVGLGHRLHATPATLSGGERQRVAIARAIVGTSIHSTPHTCSHSSMTSTTKMASPS
jgi:putative ABC transport system ATP-binding protein